MTLHTLQVGMEWFGEHAGGLNRVYAHLLSELRAQGVESLGLVAGTSAVAQLSHGLARSFALRDSSAFTRYRAVRAAARPWLHDHTSNAVVVSHFAPYALPLLGLAGTRPFVVHFQGPWGQESRAEGASHISWMAKEMLERRVYRRADAAIVLSGAFAEILVQRFGMNREKIHVIPGGVEYERFAIARSMADCRAALGWPANRPIVLCVRRLVHRVGLDALIDATLSIRHRVPEVLVLIAGTGPLRAHLAEKISALGLETSVRLIGFVPDEQLPLAYRAATLTVVPSQSLEGFGLVTVESLAAGTPCVVTPVGGLADIVTPLAPQLVTSTARPSDIADSVVDALSGNMPLPSAAACAHYAHEHFDWPVIAARVARVYEATLA